MPESRRRRTSSRRKNSGTRRVWYPRPRIPIFPASIYHIWVADRRSCWFISMQTPKTSDAATRCSTGSALRYESMCLRPSIQAMAYIRSRWRLLQLPWDPAPGSKRSRMLTTSCAQPNRFNKIQSAFTISSWRTLPISKKKTSYFTEGPWELDPAYIWQACASHAA